MAARKPQPEAPDVDQPVHSPEALQRVWDASIARRGDAVQLAEQLDGCDNYIERTREMLAKAEADRVQIADRHAATLAEANGLQAMVVEYCGTHQLPLPKTPAPEPPPLEAALSVLGDRSRKHPEPVRARTMTEVTHLDPYAHLLGYEVKVIMRDQVEVHAGTLHSLDNGHGRVVLLDKQGEAFWWPERAQVERIEPLDHDHDDDAGDPYGGDPLNEYGTLPPRPADTRPDVGGQPAAEARALAVRPATSALLAFGVWLTARRPRHAGSWRMLPHRAGSLTSGPVRLPSSAVQGATI